MGDAYSVPNSLGSEEVQAWSVLHWSLEHTHCVDRYHLSGVRHHACHVPCRRAEPYAFGYELHYRHQWMRMAWCVDVLLRRWSEVVSLMSVLNLKRDWLTEHRFEGPKITLNLDDLSESQEKAIAEEGIEVEHEKLPASGTQNVPLAKEVAGP